MLHGPSAPHARDSNVPGMPKLKDSQIVTVQFAEVVTVSNISARKSYDMKKKGIINNNMPDMCKRYMEETIFLLTLLVDLICLWLSIVFS